MSGRVEIRKLASGVPGLDAVLGGGIPELSFNLIAGGPGAGKTTLAHQIMFASASTDRPALYITILGEPPVKMLRYQQQHAFFAPARIPGQVRFLYLGAELLSGGLQAVLDGIVREVEATSPALVFVDSFRSVVWRAGEPGQLDLQSFVQRLGLHLTGWDATTFLIGEYEAHEADASPIFTVADGIIWLGQTTHRGAAVRHAQVVKMRGQAPLLGRHPMAISDGGVRIYPRIAAEAGAWELRGTKALPGGGYASGVVEARRRLETGAPGLDAMLGGGAPGGASILVAGAAGTGKTRLGQQFLRAGFERGERGVALVLEPPAAYLAGAVGPAGALARAAAEGALSVVPLGPGDRSGAEVAEQLVRAVRERGASRVVIDPLEGLLLSLAPVYRGELRETLHRVLGELAGLGATTLIAAGPAGGGARDGGGDHDARLIPDGVAFLVDGLLLLRQVEQGGRLRRALSVAKLRGSAHSHDLRWYEVGADGLVVGEPLAR